jgi:hypothetical protein
MKSATRFGLYVSAGAAFTAALFLAPSLWMITRGNAAADLLVGARFVGGFLGYAAAVSLWALKGERSRGRAVAAGSLLTNCWMVLVWIWGGLLGATGAFWWVAPTAVVALAVTAFVLFNFRPQQTPGVARRPLEPLLRRTPINNLPSLAS